MDCAPDARGCRVTRLVLWHAQLAAHAHAMTNRLDTLGARTHAPEPSYFLSMSRKDRVSEGDLARYSLTPGVAAVRSTRALNLGYFSV